MHDSMTKQPGSGQLYGMHCLGGLTPQTQLVTHTLDSTSAARRRQAAMGMQKTL